MNFMILKYDIEINNKIISERLQNLINQTYKLLPNREQGIDWKKPLQTILEQLIGMYRLMNDYSEIFFPLLNKMEGLYSLTKDDDFSCYRRTIFECLGLMNELRQNICHHQNC